MSSRLYSLIIPVYNRPEELGELFQSLKCQISPPPFEVVVVEDGSDRDARALCDQFKDDFEIQYFFKENTGPGDSRNYGMSKAKGEYFIILDSDCILPAHYLRNVEDELNQEFCSIFGGPDRAHKDFNAWQKAVSYAMTSPLSTGGIRGGRKSLSRFQPRSFNMGLSADLFKEIGGYSDIHPGEDPDLSLRVFKAGYDSRLFPDAYVFHKRRINPSSFLRQVYLFGLARPLLDSWHPETKKLLFALPTVFLLGGIASIALLGAGFPFGIYLYGLYAFLLFVHGMLKERSLFVAILGVLAVFLQLFGYGWGFLKSKFLLTFRKESPEVLLPELYRFKRKPLAR